MILLMSFLACNSNADAPNPTATPEQPTTPSAAPAPSADAPSANAKSAALPNLKDGLSKEGCDNGPGVMGAASYFVGEITILQTAPILLLHGHLYPKL